VQADNYFKVRAGKDSIEFPFVTEYSTDAARAETAARDAHTMFKALHGSSIGGDEPTISVYDATDFPDYPQIGDWAEEDLRDVSEPEATELH
jgi:hypothetical protein